MTTGDVKCWGENGYSQLGFGSRDLESTSTPMNVNLGPGIRINTSVSADY
jgi:hypothetical protein